MKSFYGVLLVCAFAGAFSVPPDLTPASILDDAVKNALESMRPSLKDLEIQDIYYDVKQPEVNVSFSFKNGLVENLDDFKIVKLTTSLIPLRVTNLTMTWEKVKITGEYDLSGVIDIPGVASNLTIYGKGKAKIVLKGIFFTIASKFVLASGRPQIPEKGLYGFDVYLNESDVQLENIQGGGEKEEVINRFLSLLIPNFVRDHKKEIFENLQDDLIEMINGFLAGKNDS